MPPPTAWRVKLNSKRQTRVNRHICNAHVLASFYGESAIHHMDIHFDIRNHRYSDSLEILIISNTDRKNALAQRYWTRKKS